MVEILTFLLFALLNPEPHSIKHKCKSNDDCGVFYECSSKNYSLKASGIKGKRCIARNIRFLQELMPEIIDFSVQKCGGTKRLARLLKAVARRESNSKFWVSHWLPSDVRAGQIALRRNAWRYQNNEFLADRFRWQTLGYFGLTSANFLYHYDPSADPLSIANPIISVHVWAQAAAVAYRKMRRGVQCEGLGLYKPKRITYGDVHRAVNGGSLCPRKGAKHDWMMRNERWAFSVQYSAKDLKVECF